MGRRQVLVLVSALAMILLGAGVVGGLVAATQSDGGRDWIRRQVSREANRGLNGRIHIGKLSGSFLTDLSVDSIEIRDPDDSVFVASGPISVRFDPRDLADGRFIFRAVELEHPLLVIRKEQDGHSWNFRKIFPNDSNPGPSLPRSRGSFGSLVLFHQVRITDGEIQLTKPWTPDDSLTGARRDSAIAFNIADGTEEIRRVMAKGRRGYQKTWRWAHFSAEIPRLRFRHPDSTGRKFEIAKLDVKETVPPFDIRGMRGSGLWRGDTVWFDTPHFSLPGSTGSAVGKVEWPTGDMFWDVHVKSDSVALEDIHWIYETLPRAGYGSMLLHVKTHRTNSDLTDYVITNMDVKSRGSRLRGNMTYGVGGAVLEVRDVALSLEPADFTLLETLNGQPFPYAWRGTLAGMVRASGGPVNHFKVESADIVFTDRNVPGATAKGTGHGEIDILDPGDAKFHGFQLDLEHFDMRTGQFLNKSFPELNGVVGGTATLDSIWTDVRLTNADITHRDGDDVPASRFRGAARVTLGDDFVSFDATTTALPLSASALAKSYPSMPLRGEYRGSLRAVGTVADFALSTDLISDAGRVQIDGQFDAFEPLYRATARGTLTGFDFRRGFGMPNAPVTDFDGRFSLDVAGDSLDNLTGTAQLTADRSLIDSVRLFGGRAALRFGNGRVQVDSARFESVAGQLTARGALGLTPSVTDTLRFQYTGDSLGGLRRYLARATSAGAVADSLAGSLSASGLLTGRTSRFALDATVDGTGLLLRTTAARQVRGTIALSALPDSATGAITVRLDNVHSGTAAFTEGTVRADLLNGDQARVSAHLAAASGAQMRALADVRRRADSTIVRLDSLWARTTSNVWSLGRSSTIAMAGRGFRLDTLVMAGATGGRINATGRTSGVDTIALTLRADAVPLADVGELIQTRDAMLGRLSLRADVRGTRDRPDFFFTGALSGARVAGFALEDVEADGRYADRRLTTAIALRRKGVPALHADAALPIDLAFEPAGSRFPEEQLVAHVRTDSAGLGILESFFPSVRDARGSLRMDLDVAGTWRHPRATGSLSLADGSLALRQMGLARIEGLEADIGFLGDSIAVRRLSARNGRDLAGTAAVTGGISIRDVTDAAFGLRFDAFRFNVLNEPRVADLDLTGNLQLGGRRSSAVLSGGFTVDRGEIRLPELYQKRVISLDDPNLYRVVDTTALMNRTELAGGDSVFMNNLTLSNLSIRMGPDVWLRSAEANINLGGQVSVTRGRTPSGPNAGRSQLVLEGPLQTVRGTYRLNLGPVQRAFTVESGEVRFYGDPDLNATLNINALHVVRQLGVQSARPDVRVRVRIGGTRLSPTAELSTPDSARVTTGDLISYLTTGGPSSDISRSATDYRSTGVRLLVSSAGSLVSAKAVSGGFCDDAQLTTAGLDAYQGRLLNVGGQVLEGTRFNCARQLTERAFVRLDAGLCRVGQLVGTGTTNTPIDFADAFGVKLDYLLAAGYTLSAGVEPPTSAVYCRNDASARGFAPTPRQFGVDLSRLWRF